MKDSVFRLRLPEATREAWDVAAAELGVSTAELVRDAVSFYLAEGPELRLGVDLERVPLPRRVEVVSRAVAVKRDGSGRRLEACVHRVGVGLFCKRCDG